VWIKIALKQASNFAFLEPFGTVTGLRINWIAVHIYGCAGTTVTRSITKPTFIYMHSPAARR